MFRKKVHPESSTAAQKSGKHHKNQKKKKTINNGGYNKSDLVHPEEDSSVNREYWIKTDADCKYTIFFFISLFHSLTYAMYLNFS